MNNLNIVVLMLGGILMLVFAGAVIWVVVQLLIDVFDWIAGAIETAWRKERGG